jgi:hypothetical protein
MVTQINFYKYSELFSFLFQMEYGHADQPLEFWLKVQGNIQIVLPAFPIICFDHITAFHL